MEKIQMQCVKCKYIFQFNDKIARTLAASKGRLHKTGPEHKFYKCPRCKLGQDFNILSKIV